MNRLTNLIKEGGGIKMEEIIWRRFKLINKENEDKLLSLMKRKNLSRED